MAKDSIAEIFFDPVVFPDFALEVITVSGGRPSESSIVWILFMSFYGNISTIFPN